MRENFIIAALIVCCTATILSLSSVVHNMSYWKQRAKTAESIISIVEPNYILDVLCETDEWVEWEESK